MEQPASNSLTKISRKSLVDEVITAMKGMLGGDAWPPGTKLPSEQQLCRELGVGRSTVREALRVLEHLGLVESRSGLGTYVIDKGMPSGRLEYPQTPETIQELFEFRHTVELTSARLAAERRTAEQLSRIKEAWNRCELAVERDSADEFARLDYEFHLSIVEASGNRFLVEAYKGIESVFANYVNQILAQGSLRSMLKFHDGLIAAIETMEPDLAMREVDENFMETDVRVRLLLENMANDESK